MSRRAPRIPQHVIDEVIARDSGCVAPRLGGTSNDCWGRDRIEHVSDEAAMGMRAHPLGEPSKPATAAQLVVLCSGHTEDGMRAGYVWATDKVNRAACRAYLSEWMAAKSAAVA